MASAEQQKIATRKLTQWIENDKRIATYRDISREVGCHVNIAKNLLLNHYTSNPSLTPTYLLTGPLLSTSRITLLSGLGAGAGEEDEEVRRDEGVGRWGVVLVGAEGLEDKKKLFEQDTLNIHIHSLAPSPITDPAQYLIPNLTLREHKNYHNPQIYGTITGETLKPSAALVPDKKTMKDGGIDWSKKKVVGGDKKEEPKKKEEAKKVEPSKPNSKPITTTSSSSTATTKPAPTPASTQGSISGKKKRVIHSDTEEDEPTPPPAATKKKVEPTSSMIRADDQKAMEAMMSMDMDVDMSDEEVDVRFKKEAGTVRKKRRVRKSRTEVDKKGRMVTKDYSTDESYTASENDESPSKTKSKPAPSSKPTINKRESTSSIGSNTKTPASSGSGSHPPAKKAATGGAAKGQSTLKGFFTKK
ncbi:hypothetical protein I302_102481 [Kwoniella bestiolae CBS 10118]|uniref:DNA polymerase delta subunit 3 n=1 Tax=Kwoniella bestiolae CBS 10118 TaxID=1296100 RepID=A0AAJ8K491_9TREE